MTPESSGSSTATALRSRRDARSAVSTSAQTTVNSAAAAPGSCARRSSTSDTVCHSEVDGMVDDNARLDNLQTERAGSAHFSAATCNRSACFPRSKCVRGIWENHAAAPGHGCQPAPAARPVRWEHDKGTLDSGSYGEALDNVLEFWNGM